MTTWPSRLPNPSQSFRGVVEPSTLRTNMESGRVRARRINTRARRNVNLVWDMTPDQFAFFRAYYQDVLEDGTLSFRLPVPDGVTSAVEVATFTGGYSHDYQSTDLFVVRATLELEPRSVYTATSVRNVLGL